MIDNKTKDPRSGIYSFLVIFALITLINPNFNTIDIIPDFIGYFILAGMVKKYSTLAPYFEEVREGLSRLALITLGKIALMVIMYLNMSSGSDIVPLMTLICVTLELIVLIPLIRDLFLALYYLGERGGCMATIVPFKLFGISVGVDVMKIVAYIFVIVKEVLNLVPTFCLLTVTDDSLLRDMRSLYPKLEVGCMLTVLLVGIVFVIFASAYIKAIRKGGGIGEYVLSIAGSERLARLDYERSVKSKLFGIALLVVAAVFTLDVTVDLVPTSSYAPTGIGINLIPRFIFAFILMLAIPRLTDKKLYRGLNLIFGALYSVATIATMVFTAAYNDQYTQADLIDSTAARSAYTPIVLSSAIETILMVALTVLLAIVFIKFLEESTSALDGVEALSREQIKLKISMKIKGLIFSFMPLLLSLLKTVNSILIMNSKYIEARPGDVTLPTVVASAIPWFGALITILTVAYILFTYYFAIDVKNEIKLKYSNSNIVFE